MGGWEHEPKGGLHGHIDVVCTVLVSTSSLSIALNPDETVGMRVELRAYQRIMNMHVELGTGETQTMKRGL